MRIEQLPYTNITMQGAQRRTWLRQHAPQHLTHCAELTLHALQQRERDASQCVAVLGAGACTEVPLVDLARNADEVVLADLDVSAMKQGYEELTSPALRRRIRLVEADISGGVSAMLHRLLARQQWDAVLAGGASTVFDVAASCLEQVVVPDPPVIETLGKGECGLVVSSLVLSQLFSYPLLDLLDHIQSLAPALLGEQERHRRYQDAAQAFRVRVIHAHLHLLHELVDAGGLVTLLSDVRGFAFFVHGTDHDATHRRVLPLVPRIFPDLIRNHFTIVEEAHWEWITDLPTDKRPGRGYEVAGYVLAPL